MATFTIRAIYEEGKLRPLELLPLQEQESVLPQVIRQSAVQETAGILQGQNSEIVQEVAEGESSRSALEDLTDFPSGQRTPTCILPRVGLTGEVFCHINRPALPLPLDGGGRGWG